MISRKVGDKNVPILMLKSQRTFACEFHPHRLPWFNWLSSKNTHRFSSLIVIRNKGFLSLFSKAWKEKLQRIQQGKCNQCIDYILKMTEHTRKPKFRTVLIHLNLTDKQKLITFGARKVFSHNYKVAQYIWQQQVSTNIY